MLRLGGKGRLPPHARPRHEIDEARRAQGVDRHDGRAAQLGRPQGDRVARQPEGVVDELQTLIDLGINGFSLYELLIYPQNEKWAARHKLLDRNHLPNYLMFQAGAHLLEARGFRKNLFNHWADERDQNIYFTFPLRGEDLLAVGCLADGVFGDYHYRHLGYDEYLLAASDGWPGLMGGLRRSDLEKRLYPLILAIQSAHIGSAEAVHFNSLAAPNGQPLLDYWVDHALLEKDRQGNHSLTGSGSWFAGNMISELSRALREQAICSS